MSPSSSARTLPPRAPGSPPSFALAHVLSGFTENLAPFVPSLSPGTEGERLLTVREVAARLAVSNATIYALCERGQLRHVRIANAIRVSPADLAAFLAGPRSGGS